MNLAILDRINILFLQIIFIILLNITSSEAKVVERIAAVVNNRIITLSALNAAIELRKADIQIEEDIADEDIIREKVLWELIDRALIINEAEKFGMSKIPDAEIAEALEEMKKAYSTDDDFERALSKWGMNIDDLRLYIKEQIISIKFIDQRIRFFVNVSDEDIAKFYIENKSSFGNKLMEDIKSEVEVFLAEEEVARQLEEYIKKLKAKAEIRVNMGY